MTTLVRRPIARGVLLLCLGTLSPASAGPQEGWRDGQIFDRVAEAVLTYPQYTIFDDVSADVANGFVTLAGKVTIEYKPKDLARRVAQVPGVKEVENAITVLPASAFDDDVRYAVARAIYGHASFWHYASMTNPPIHVIVERGRLTLTGVVANEVERSLARSIAASSNAFSVSIELKTDDEMKAILLRRRQR